MAHLREFKEEAPAVHAISDPSQTREGSVQGRGMGRGNEPPSRETWGVISASLGTMRPLVAKLDKLLLARPNEGMRRIIDGVKKISSYVDELSEVEDPPRTAKCWMNEARGMSYDMEDYIDSLLFVQPVCPSHVSKDMEEDEPITAMVSEFSKYVQEVIKRHKTYVVQDSGASSALRRKSVPLGPMLQTSYEDIVIDGRMNGFIKSFSEDGDKQLKVLSLLGSACLGKTTLARVLFNKLGKQYHCRAFIRVSRKPDTKRIFRQMLWQLKQQEPQEYLSEEDLIENIKKYLLNKRFLIIIDDIWAASVWNIIEDALPKGSHGSRIVTTTQAEDVALTCCSHQSGLVFEMKPMDDNLSRELFFNRLFGSESACPKIFKEVLNKIVEMCGGLPLVTISIASLLASQAVITEDLLEHIHESLSSCLSAMSTAEITRQALNLSFNNLPQYLRTCLLYLSMRQEGYTFCKDDLVKQWIAEGFIDTTERQGAEKVAESYLHQLIGRRFIQPIRISYNNEVMSCGVHDTVHDLIAHKSTEENFIVTLDYSQKNVALSRKVRRLSLLFGDARYAKIPPNITKSQLRSLNFFGILECMPCITEYKLLRVLVLQITGHGGVDNPVDLTGISELIQLRYLKIGCGLCIKLPTDGLKCLETLDITDAIIVSNYSWQINLPSLLHLSLPSEGSLMYPDGIRWILEEAGRLNSLEDLYIPVSSTDSYDLEENSKDFRSLFQKCGNIGTVVLSHGSTGKNNVVVGAIKVITSQPLITGAPLLERFECSPHITFRRIPNWVKDLENLCILKIAVRILDIHCVGILRGLRVLTALSLYVGRETSERIIFDKAGFSALNYFNLRFTTGIARLTFDKDTMPNLWKLKLVCKAIPRMDQHPFFSGHTGQYEQYKVGDALIVIEHLPSLREISAKFGGAAADLERIKRMGISNDPSNPNMLLCVFEASHDDQSTKQKQEKEILEKDPADETLDKAAGERSRESLHIFTLDELMLTTDHFSRANFHGDHYEKSKTIFFPGIFDGHLAGPEENRRRRRGSRMPQNVTVNCLNKFSDDQEWLMVDQTELEYLWTVRHPNLVKLLGFCDYYEHRMLVYEYLPKRSLKQYLSDDFSGVLQRSQEDLLPWLTRLKIAVGTAKALAFLHGADKPMAHGDLKASNLRLTWDYIPKLFSYRLAKENPLEKTPGSLTAKSDVYNFGVVLLELLAGRLAGDKKQPGAEKDLVEWSRTYLSCEDKLHHIIDPNLKGQYTGHAVWSIATIVRRCLDSVPEKRPSMGDVVEALEPLLIHDDEPSQAKNVGNKVRRIRR